jgi:hypothetical protein
MELLYILFKASKIVKSFHFGAVPPAARMMETVPSSARSGEVDRTASAILPAVTATGVVKTEVPALFTSTVRVGLVPVTARAVADAESTR